MDALHFFRKIAAKPSGPEAEVFDSSSMASKISCSVKVISLSVGICSSSSAVRYGLDVGELKTEEY